MLIFITSLKGARESNEDQHDTILNIDGKIKGASKINFFGIYDGHGGKLVSKYLKDHLHKYFLRPQFTKYLSSKDQFSKYNFKVYDMIQDKLRINNRNFSEHMGSTALSIIQYQKSKTNHKNIIYVSNLGDCRAVLCNKDNIAIPLTKDHKPMAHEEYIRITNLGGKIVQDNEGTFRIKDLSLSRAFGDFDASPFVSHTPDINKYEIGKNDKFIIMACDGLWDVVSNQDAIDFVLNRWRELNVKVPTKNTLYSQNNKKNIAATLGQYAIKIGSMDNITIQVIFF